MSKPLLEDTLWDEIEPLLPVEPPKPRGGRPRVSDRAALTGILFVLQTGLPWEMLPQEMKCGSGMTCWRRLKAWHEAGVWEALHLRLLCKLHQSEQLDWSRAIVDSSSVRAVGVSSSKERGAKPSAPIPPTAPAPAPSTTS